jgi:hypothetical protein
MPVTSVAMLASQAQALDGLLPCQRENPPLWFSGLPADPELARAARHPTQAKDLPGRAGPLPSLLSLSRTTGGISPAREGPAHGRGDETAGHST